MLNEPGCKIEDLGFIIEWLGLEITAFYINLLVLVFFTFYTYISESYVEAIYRNKLQARYIAVKNLKHVRD